MTDEEFNNLYEVEFSKEQPEIVWNGTIKEFNDEYGTSAKTRKDVQDILNSPFGMGGLLEGMAAIRVTTKGPAPRKIGVFPYDADMWSDSGYRKIVYECVRREFSDLDGQADAPVV